MTVIQKTFDLPPFKRGFHLITHLVEQQIGQIKNIKAGIAQVFIHHTSAGLTINENADPTVRGDFERHFNVMVPENAPYYRHTLEGPDDMPAHIKASMLGNSVSIPVKEGQLLLGIWQGIYLCEHRNDASGRTITVTLIGE
jgi:secondary thiamine-phosphate synthase enzyme